MKLTAEITTEDGQVWIGVAEYDEKSIDVGDTVKIAFTAKKSEEN